MLVVATLGDGKPPVSLTGDAALLSEFLAKQFNGQFQGAGQVEGVAQLLKDATIGPAAVIGSAAFLKSQTGEFDEWLKGREKNPAVFKNLCTGIRSYNDKGQWQIEFNVFNTVGGVDSLKASGGMAPLTIQALVVKPVKPAGEFSYPLEGQSVAGKYPTHPPERMSSP